MWSRFEQLLEIFQRERLLREDIQCTGEEGYSLLEILVVLAIIGTLMGLVAPRLLGNVDKSKIIAAKAQARSISLQLQGFKLDMGRFPTEAEGFQVLVDAPADDTGNWQGPYFEEGVVPKDHWGFDFIYVPATTGINGNQLKPKVTSLGADNAPGGSGPNQDITL